MNDSMILLARLRRGEMIREAEHDKRAASARRGERRPARTVRPVRPARLPRTTGGPVTRMTMAVARMRPTTTGR